MMNANYFSEMESLDNSKYWLHAKTESELKELLDMFWGFHDFRIESVQYRAFCECIDVMLEYDTFDPSDYGYGTYTIKIVYHNVVNSSDSFSVAWY